MHKDMKRKALEKPEDIAGSGKTVVDEEDASTTCPLCSKKFNSVRELVTHRQLHPQFKNHTCKKCSAEFEHFAKLRKHK